MLSASPARPLLPRQPETQSQWVMTSARWYKPVWKCLQFFDGPAQRLIKFGDLGTREREPQRHVSVGVKDNVCWQGAGLPPGVEHPGGANLIDPGAAFAKW